MSILPEVMGSLVAMAADRAWTRWEGSEAYAVDGDAPLYFIEHYHWGLASLLVASRLKKKSWSRTATGVGVTLIAQEATHDVPFGSKVPANLVTATLLTGGLLLSLGSKK